MNAKERIPQEMKPLFESITDIIDNFCRNHLNQEYADLCRQMTATLCRKRPSPLASGAVEIWASSILYTIGKVNFLFDQSQKPHMRAERLCALLGTSKATVSAKAKKIMQLLKIGLFDPRWSLPSRLDQNPMAWLIQVDGFIVDARSMSVEIQEEAFRRGLIPYIPVQPQND